jgi:hypothetical protein
MLGKVPLCELLVSTIVSGTLRDLERTRRIRGPVYFFVGSALVLGLCFTGMAQHTGETAAFLASHWSNTFEFYWHYMIEQSSIKMSCKPQPSFIFTQLSMSVPLI